MAAAWKNTAARAQSANSVANPTNLAPALPTRAAGDLLIIVTTCRSITATVATPSGWTIWPGFPKRSATASGGSIYVFYKFSDGTDSVPTVAWSGVATGTSGDSSQATITSCTGADPTTPSDQTVPTPTDASAANPSIPSITTVTAEALVLGIAMKVSDTAQTGTIANSFTERGDNHTTTGTGHIQYVATRDMASPAATGASTVTASSGTAARCLSVPIAIKPYVRVPPATPTGAYGSVVHAASGLLHYWRLDEPSGVVAFDYKSTLDGAYVGSPTLNQTGLIASEATGKCTQFDGTNDSVDIPDAASLDLTSAISVEFWVDATSAFPADDTVVQKGGAWSFWSAGGALRFEVDGANSAERPGGATPSGKYHVVGTYDRTTVRLYLNGVEVATGAATAAIIATANPMAVGRDTGGAPLYFAGKISDVAVYSVALAPATVLAHYNAAQAGGPGIYSKGGGGSSLRHAGGGDKLVQSKQAGGTLAPLTAGGAKKVVVVKTGGGVSTRSAGGPKAVGQAVTKTGGGVGARSSGGPKVVAYADTGGATSALTTGGAKLAASIETGGATSALSSGGGKKPIYADTGGATSAFFAGGAKAVSQSVPKTGGGATTLSSGGPKLVQQAYPKTGGATTPLTTGGPKNPAYADTGGAASTFSTGGAKKAVYTDTGGATAPFSTGGAKKTLGPIETGGATTPLTTGGARKTVYTDTGGATWIASTGGAKNPIYADTGGAATLFSAGGPSSVSAGGVFDKTGGGVTTLVGGAAKLLTKLATGGGISARLAGAAKLLAKVATGGGVTAHTTGGAKKVQYQDTGGASSTLTTGGAKKLVSIEAGGATVVLVAGGPKSLALSFSKTGGGISARLAGAAKVATSVKTGGGASSLTGGTSKNVIVVRGGPGGADYEDEVLADSPRYYWRMGDMPPPLLPAAGALNLVTGLALDPSAVTGALTGAQNDGAAQFDGTAALKAVGVNFGDTDMMTAELWLWWDSYTNNDDLALEFANGNAGFFLNPNSSISAAGTPIAGATFGVAMHPGSVGFFFEMNFARPSAAAWHHIVVVLDKSLTPAPVVLGDSDAIRLYVDGVRRTGYVTNNATKAGETWGDGVARDLFVMSRQATSLIAAGRVDELALYEGALDEARIEAHYTAGSTVAGPGGIGATTSMGGGGSSVLDFGNLVSKAGGATSALFAGGAKVVAAVLPKTGGGIGTRLAGGAKLLTKVATGGGRLTATTGGVKQVQYANTGGATTVLRTGGTKQLSSTKTGGANVVFSAGGPKVADFGLFYIKTGGAVASLSVGATKVVASVRTGGGVTPLLGGGADKTVYSDTGGATLIMRSGGGCQLATVKTGGGVLGLRAGGPSSLDFGQFISKTGGAIAGLLGGGAKKAVRLVTGGVLGLFFSGATRRTEARDSGGATLSLTAGGVKAPARSYTGGAVLSFLAGGGAELDRTQTKTGGGRAAFSSGAPKFVLSDRSGGATVLWRSGGAVAKSIALPGGAALELSGAVSVRVTSVRTGGGRLSYTSGSGTAFRGGAFVNFTAGASTTLTIVRSGGATLGLLAAGSRMLVPTAESGGRLLSGGVRHAVLSSSGRRHADVLNANERGLTTTGGRRGGEVEGSRHHADLT